MAQTKLEVEKLSFEEAFKELESIVEKLENDQVSLEESLHLFEVGQSLSKYCAQLLDVAEQRLRTLQPDFSSSLKEDEN